MEVRLDRHTVWLIQRQLAELFETNSENALMHLHTNFADGEVESAATTQEFLVVHTAGISPVNRSLQSFDLAAILTIGYRGPFHRGKRFCRWATRILREHLLPQPASREHRGLHASALIKVTA